MYNFIFDVPVKIIFGKNSIANIPNEIAQYGSRVLLCYGGGSIKRTGIYESVTTLLNENGIFLRSRQAFRLIPALMRWKRTYGR